MPNKLQLRTNSALADRRPARTVISICAGIRTGALILLCMLVLYSTMMTPSIAHSEQSMSLADVESGWVSKTIISQRGQGSWAIKGSLAMGSMIIPEIVFIDLENNLVYAYIQTDVLGGLDWTTAITDIITTSESITAISFAIDSKHNSHVVFVDSNLEVKYAFKDRDPDLDFWTIETVDTRDTYWTSIAIDSADKPHIAYSGGYTTKTGGVWNSELVSWPSGGGRCSIAIDTNDIPHITYGGWYANKTNGVWSFSGIVPGTGEWDGSLALDSQDKPHVSYYLGGDLKIAWIDEGVWTSESVDTAGNVGTLSSLAIDSEDNSHIVYYDHTNSDVKYASKSDENWEVRRVDDMTDNWFQSSQPFSLIERVDGDPHFIYPSSAPAGMDTDFQLNWVFIDNVPPHADAGEDRNIRVNEIQAFGPVASNDNYAIVKWVYDFGDGGRAEFESYRTGLVYTYKTAGTYTLQLTVTDVGGNEDTDTAIIKVEGQSGFDFQQLLPILSVAASIIIIVLIIYAVKRR